MIKSLYLFPIGILLCFNLAGQISADFSSPAPSGCIPLNAKLNDSSSGPITFWEWTRDGVFFSSTQNPNVLLSTAGQYEICLTVGDAAGNIDQTCKQNFFEVFADPIPQISSNVTEGCLPLAIDFSNNSTLGSGALTSVIWDFGGSCGVVNATPSETVSCSYDIPGSYQVTLIVNDINGCSASATFADYISANPDPFLNIPLPDFDACQPPFNVDLTNANIEDNVIYSWDFGNGETFIGPDPSIIVYPNSGPYSITVNALNSQTGCVDSIELIDAVEELYPISYSFDRSTNCGIPEVIFTDNSVGNFDAILWDFDDGNTSTIGNPTHTFTGFGCFDVEMTRTIGACTKSIQQLICIDELTEGSVSATFSNQASCSIPHTSNFSLNDAPGFSYSWNFGDGITSNSAFPSHTYDMHGDYAVILTVEDPLGCQITINVGTVEVQPLGLGLGSFGEQGCVPLEVEVKPDFQSASSITSINWILKDENNILIDQSNLENPTFTMNTPGCYHLSVVMMNAEGCSFSQTYDDIYCAGLAPMTSFNFSPASGCFNQIFQFNNLTTGDFDFVAWDFNSDGTPESNIQNPSYTYLETGCFDPVLTVSNYGCANSSTQGQICVEPPQASFTHTINCEIPTEVSFTNTSIGSDSVYWDFGMSDSMDDSSTLINPVFTYPALGNYVVSLVTYNAGSGCTDTIATTISLAIPSASFNLDTMRYCMPAKILPTNTSTGASSYVWSLPNGGMINSSTLASPTITFSTPGNYSIQLNILDAIGCGEEFIINNIQVGGPEVDFDHSLSGDCIPFVASFSDLSSNLLSNNEFWSWDIGSGFIQGQGQHFSANFDTIGLFPVKLVVEDEWGCTDSVSTTVSFNENAPLADFESIFNTCDNVENLLTNTSQGSNLSYVWNFGDGSSSILENPIHVFTEGTYDVCLSIQNANCTNTHCELFTVQDVQANFSVDPNYSACAPSQVNFINKSVNGSTFSWSFGDLSNGSLDTNASHFFILEGNYDVLLTAQGENAACVDTILLSDIVTISGPQADIDFQIDDYCVPAKMEVVVQTDRLFDITLFYGDGNSSEFLDVNSVSEIYTFESASDVGFIPAVLISESDLCQTFIDEIDTIRLGELKVDVFFDRDFICGEDRSVLFTCEVISSVSDFDIQWEFESGSPSSSAEEEVMIDFPEEGFFDVSLIVNNEFCSDTIFLEGVIESYSPGTLLAEDQSSCEGDTLKLQIEGNVDYVIWSGSDLLNDSTSFSPVAFFSDTTVLIVKGAHGPCPEVSDTIQVVVNENPIIEMPESELFFSGEELVVGPESSSVLNNYNWMPEQGLSCHDCPNPIYLGDTPATYTLKMVEKNTGCFSEKQIRLTPYSVCTNDMVYIPSVFSPDGDGVNDKLYVDSRLIDNISRFQIFNRWGEMMYSNTNLYEGWDGKYLGKDVQPGVFVYTLQFICPIDNTLISQTGTITVLK